MAWAGFAAVSMSGFIEVSFNNSTTRSTKCFCLFVDAELTENAKLL